MDAAEFAGKGAGVRETCLINHLHRAVSAGDTTGEPDVAVAALANRPKQSMVANRWRMRRIRWDRANGTVAGLSMSSKPVEVLRAAMEAVAFRFALIAEMLETASPGEKEVVASGGGLLHSPTWTRIMADTLGKPVTLSGVKEASSRGAALIALEALGGPEIEAAEAPLGETFEPDPDRHEIYRKALERQRRLYEAVLDRRQKL